MREAKESVAVLVGLCHGGHLEDARSFVERGVTWGSVKWLLPTAKFFPAGYSSSGADYPKLTRDLALSNDDIRVFVNEVWSQRGIIELIEGVCKGGHLDVLKWVLSAFPIDEERWNRRALLNAIIGVQVDLLLWLTSQFSFADTNWEVSSLLKPKHGVQDIKRLVEAFPQWRHSSSVVCVSAARCKKSSADEVLSVCKWLKNKFHLEFRSFFVDDSRIPKHPEVFKWIFTKSGEKESKEICTAWCEMFPSIELAVWFNEEKSVTFSSKDLIAACGNREDNLNFVKWLYQKIFIDTATTPSSKILLDSLQRAICLQNEKIVEWLIALYLRIYSAKPVVFLKPVCYVFAPIHKYRGYLTQRDCIKWLFDKCGGKCDVTFSPTMAEEVQQDSPTLINSGLSLLKAGVLPQVWCLTVLKSFSTFGTLSQVKELVSLAAFSREEISSILTKYTCFSSKVVKWLVSEFDINSSNLEDAASLFVGLIENNKRGCALWVWHKFQISLTSVLSTIEFSIGPREKAPARLADQWREVLSLFRPADISRPMLRILWPLVNGTTVCSSYTLGQFLLTVADWDQLVSDP
ncbi:hypothetical protein Pelo_14028 [Pelomyxa schiedti]|nr:hypothetical protein Pelo_14028 [Pelomyxa schiedti]